MSYQQPQYQHYQYQMPQPPSNGPATASMILGILAILIGPWAIIPILGVIPGVTGLTLSTIGVTLGHKGATVARQTGRGKGEATTGITLGYTTIGIIIAIIALWNLNT